MKVTLLTLGKPRDKHLRTLVEGYLKRLRPHLPVELVHVPDDRGGRSPDQARQEETKRILRHINVRDFVILLDEAGNQMDSRIFSEWFYRCLGQAGGRLVLVIGGAHGVSDELKERADALCALSAMTFPHELCLLFLVEQLYRAAMIRAGSPYHH